jgi:hypothetical protein
MPVESTMHNQSHTKQRVLKNTVKSAVIAMALGEKK